MFGYKISSFFLILVLLLSVTNLPTFSTTQLNSDSYNLNGLSVGLIGVAFADDDDDDEEGDDEDDNGKDKKEKKDKKENKGHKGGKQEIKVEIKNDKTKVEIKINDIKSKLELKNTDLDDILRIIQLITGLSESEIKDIWEIEIKENGDDGDHGKKDKITICHIPPGNPDNAHTISVSGNAKNAHLAHGDTLEECPDGDEDKQDDDGQDNTTTITLTKQVTNDNQGTAGSDDFEISVNGTIVLSGSTTEVAPDVLFAINEAAVDGYEFVEITGDPECPTNLGEETILLAPGQDINCIIHNNDVGDATTITLTKQVTNDNQGTAGSDDFEISVNGTIVLSGSTTEVAPDVLFAINEAAVDGYEFVEITGDPECSTNLDEKTISLAAGQDINCTIHNNDVGDATPDNEKLSQLIDENKKLKEDIVRQEEQIDDLNEQIDFLSELIASIQGFFGNLFG